MTVNEFLKIATKNKKIAEYNQEVIIQTYDEIEYMSGLLKYKGRILAQGKACELLNINDVEGVVNGLQEFQIIEINRIPKVSEITGIQLPACNRPYLLLVQ